MAFFPGDNSRLGQVRCGFLKEEGCLLVVQKSQKLVGDFEAGCPSCYPSSSQFTEGRKLGEIMAY